jgi:hypothetical protein
MTKQTINIGTSPNKGDGDPLRIAFEKINSNFTELYNSSVGNSNNGFTGSKGNTGFTGSAGVNGFVGSFGFTGSQGNIGFTGSAGADGVDANPDSIIKGAFNITLNATGDFIPGTDILQDMGSPTNRFRHVYVGPGSVYIGDNVITQAATGGLVLPGLTRATGYYADGVDDEDDWGTNPVISNSVTVIDATRYAILAGQTPSANYSPATYIAEKSDNRIDEVNIDNSGSGWTKEEAEYARNNNMYATNVLGAIDNFNTADWIQIPFRVEIKAEDIEYEDVFGGSGSGLPTITIPEEIGTTYKGLQVSYGMVHSNGSQSELNVNKIVIHKPAITTTTINPTSSQDDFAVTGLVNSDVLAMFVLYGDVNGPKSLSTLQAFAEAAIDNVILDGGVAGDYNTVDQMKNAFYTNYSALAIAAGGLDQDFNFFNGDVLTTVGTTTVREGSGAVFEIADSGLGTYNIAGMLNNGRNYLPGHKILVLGTALGGATPDNDCIVTVDSISEGGLIFQWSVSGVAAGAEPAVYSPVTGTNYQTGSGLTVGSINPNNFFANVTNPGSNYVAGDLLDLPGSDLQNGTSPNNDIVIRIETVTVGGGAATSWEYLSGTVPPGTWPTNNISDGGNDQYDTANYINSSLATQIAYNNGDTVADGTTEFGAGSSYTFVYNTGIFGLLVTGNQSTSVSTSGNSGADGNSITEAGNIYGPNIAEQTFNNAVTHINIVGNPYAGPIVSFTHSDNGNEVDILIPDDGDGAGVGITRDNNNGIYNPYREGSWDNDVSPGGTLWNIDGWADFSDVETRTYQSLYAAFGSGGLGNKIVGAECVMYLPDNDKYYAVKFDAWTQNNNGGGFAYTRRELDLTSLSEGIRFTDGTRLKSSEGLGRVKLESPGARRIEEAHGYKSVTVTAVTPGLTQNAVIRQNSNNWDFYVNATPELTQLYDTQNTFNYLEFSFDGGNTWVKVRFGGGQYGVYYQMVFEDNINRPVVADAVVSYRTVTGGAPVVWWNSADLPGGNANFRGAVIDYHAFTGDGTIVGTIHIVDDDGEENITHTEVSSGGTNLENDDLWFVQNESTISYRRIDGAGRTLKVQWTAKVFYGSEIYD